MIYLNLDKPQRWKQDIEQSVDYFNRWFITFAPEAFRAAREGTIERAQQTLQICADLRAITPEALKQKPDTLTVLRMCTAPPLAIDRLAGLAGVNRRLIQEMEHHRLPAQLREHELNKQLQKLCDTICQLLDLDLFPWLKEGQTVEVTPADRTRAATIIADRLCNTLANPIIRNEQERRQLRLIATFLEQHGYTKQSVASTVPISTMRAGTYAIRSSIIAGKERPINIPIDVVIQPKNALPQQIPIFIEAKSAGDFVNPNKRRKEEANKMQHLRAAFGDNIRYILFLCGYFGSDYLGYEAAEGIDWVWEHRIEDLALLID